jgi:hypothetical protein
VEFADPAARLTEALTLDRVHGNEWGAAVALEKAAVLAAAEGNVVRAGRLAGAADGLREAAGIERSRFDREWLDRHLSRVAGGEFETSRAEGRALEPEEALREALEGARDRRR